MTREDLLLRLAEAKILIGGTYNATNYRFAEDELKRTVRAFMAKVNPDFSAASKFAELLYWLYHDLHMYPKTCPRCNKPITHFHSFPLGYLREYCSNRCAQLSSAVRSKIEQTQLERRGVAHHMHDAATKQKIATTNLARYGHENPFGNADIKQKIIESNLRNFGVPNPSQSAEVHQRKVETCRANFGTAYGSQHPIVRQRVVDTHLRRYGFIYNNREQARQTCLTRYNAANVAHVAEFVQKRVATLRQTVMGDACGKLDDPIYLQQAIDEKPVEDVASDLGVGSATVYIKVKQHGLVIPNRHQTRPELHVERWLTTLQVPYETRNRTVLIPQEIDFLIPSHNLGIEINGVYWHSTRSKPAANYHLNKTVRAAEQGIRLLHFFDDEIFCKGEIVCSKIAGLLGYNRTIMARKCEIVSLGSTATNTFLDIAHLQGRDQASIRYGLLFDGLLVAAMTFTRSRFDKGFQWELSRYAALPYLHVVGGPSRLLRHFVREMHPQSLMTYADRRMSVGGLYDRLGFTWLRDTIPGYFYVINGARENRLRWQKHQLAAKLKRFDPSLSEAANMELNGYHRVYDCGHRVYGMTFN